MQKHNKIIILNCDGASRGNPGHAAVGGVVKDDSGNVITEFSEYIGIATNNVAEYKALICGLKKISELPEEKLVKVFSDSELMVKQINGYYRVKEPSLQMLAQEVTRLKRDFSGFEIHHVMRDQNKKADVLANRSLNNKDKGDVTQELF